ncbi:MAG: hypothetical protein Q9182_003208 [Xanthomendoza sp. 2 TL-2023]
MAHELVLITGGTGFIGYAVVVRALQQGYRLRLAIRSENDVEKIKTASSCQKHAASIEFIVVKDMTKQGAFVEAMNDVSFVIHVASPTGGPDKMHYSTSKVLAYNATQDFLREQKPNFSVINIMPSIVLGRHELRTTPEEINGPNATNSFLLAAILGEGMPIPLPGNTVHVDDVAMVHIAALDPKVEGNQDFVLSGGEVQGIRWDDATEIVRRRFPEAVGKGLLPLKGSTETKVCKVDGRKAERVFGFRYMGFEEQVVSVVGQYLDAVEHHSKQ